MLLENVAHYNDLSPKLREELTERVKSFGKVVRYRFDISKPNPDPSKYNGDTIWPNLYTLDPTIFTIIDPYEDAKANPERKGKSRSKMIALVDGIDKDGKPDKFRKIRLHGRFSGVLRLDLEEGNDDFNFAMYMELHPKTSNGMFPDKTKHQVVTRIDEVAAAEQERKARSARKLAMDTAERMTEAEIEEFADAMSWDKESPLVLRNKIEALAETTPVMFNDLVNDKKMKFQAAIKRGIDNKILLHDPAEGKLMWQSTQQPIVVLGIGVGDKSDIERFAEWFMTAGEKADEVFKKLSSLLGKSKAAATTV